MIQTVPIPPLRVNRIGQMEISQGCIAYQDPNTGLWISDPNTPCGNGAGGLVPFDPGAGDAVAQWAAASNAAANSAALNASSDPASLVLAESLMAGNIPSPLPGLGVTVPDPMKKWLLIGAAVLGGVVLFQSGGRSR